MTEQPYAESEPWASVTDHYLDQERVRENGARLATVIITVTSEGSGEIKHDGVLPFDCAFTEKPGIGWGMEIDSDDLVDGFFPRVTAGVHGWQRNAKGQYLGAYVYFTIDLPVGYDPDDVPSTSLIHTFTFHGVAMKRVPDYLLDD